MVSTHFSIHSPSHSCFLLPCLLVPRTSNSSGPSHSIEWKTTTLSCNVLSHYYVTAINVDLFLRTRNDLAKALGLLKAQIDSNVCLNGSKAGTMATSAPLNYPGMWCYFSLQRYVLMFTQTIRIVPIKCFLSFNSWSPHQPPIYVRLVSLAGKSRLPSSQSFPFACQVYPPFFGLLLWSSS